MRENVAASRSPDSGCHSSCYRRKVFASTGDNDMPRPKTAKKKSQSHLSWKTRLLPATLSGVLVCVCVWGVCRADFYGCLCLDFIQISTCQGLGWRRVRLCAGPEAAAGSRRWPNHVMRLANIVKTLAARQTQAKVLGLYLQLAPLPRYSLLHVLLLFLFSV